jgi:hypothetical protein
MGGNGIEVKVERSMVINRKKCQEHMSGRYGMLLLINLLCGRG